MRNMENTNGKIVIYQADDGRTQIDVRLEEETVWLNVDQMALLFDREESNIRRHVGNVFKEGELERENNVHFLHVNGFSTTTASSTARTAANASRTIPWWLSH